MDKVFQSVGFKKSVYKDLESIDIDAIFRFCKSENFQYIVDNYILSEENYKDKINDINSFISNTSIPNFFVLYSKTDTFVIIPI